MTGFQAHDVILEKLDNQFKIMSTYGAKLDEIELSLRRLEVQDERITTNAMNIKALWRKYDEAFGTDGIVSDLKSEFRASKASCPQKHVEASIQRQWAAIGFIGTMIAAGLLKTFGIFK